MKDIAMQIRPYTSTDYASVIAIYKEGELFEEEMDSEEILKRKTERDPESLLVGLKNDQIIGTVSVVEDGRFAFVFRLAVKKSERGNGVGTKLLSEAEKLLKKRGNKTVHILVNEKESELQSYYEKLHYRRGRLWRWLWKDL
jgi:ribosomal protein S18 acetylase RimI-like enzyme